VTIQSRDLVVRLMAQSNGFEKGMKSAAASADVFAKELEKLDRRQTEAVAHVARLRAKSDREAAVAEKAAARQTEALRQRRMQAYDQIGKSAMIAGAAVAAGVALSVKAAMDWESAWAGVTKTVDGNAQQMGVLEDELRELAKTLPSSHREIAAVAEAAGQLGIKREAIAGFTKVMIDLGETTNLTADEAATSIAQIANVMGTSAGDVDNFASTLVALGNDGASTEAQILELAQRIAGAGKQVGLSEAELLSMASTLASLGINAEAGGSAISRFMSDVSVSVETGSADLQAFADVAGMTVDEFSVLFREDAAHAVAAFTDGLGQIQESGGSAIVTLEDMGITELRMRDTLLRLAGAQGMFVEQLDLGAEAWQANTALQDEAAERYETTESKAKLARNSLNDLAITLGSTFLPAVGSAAEGISDLAGRIGEMPELAQGAFAALATLTATAGLLGGGALVLVPKIAGMRAGLEALGFSAAATDKTMSRLSKTMKGGFIATAVVGVAMAVDQLYKASVEAPPAVNQLTESLLEFLETGKVSGDLARVMGADFADLTAKLDMAGKSRLSELAKDIVFLGESQKDIIGGREVIEALDQSLARLVQTGNELVAAEFFRRWSQESGQSVEDLSGRFELYQEALAGASVESKLAEGGIAGLGDAAAGATPKVQELTEAQKALESALGSFIDPLSTYQEMVKASAETTAEATADSSDSWSDYADSVTVSLNDLAARLEEDNEAHAQWRQNLLAVAASAGPEVAQILAEMGEEGVQLAAQMANGTEAEVARMAAALIANAQIGGAGAAQALDAEMGVMAAHAAAGGKTSAEALATQLGLGVPEVQAIAGRLGLTLRTEVEQKAAEAAAAVRDLTRALSSLPGSKRVTVRYDEVLGTTVQRGRFAGRTVENANGSVVDFFSAGGLREQHVAQIAPAGSWRVWAEPETGGEAYIPLAPSKRARSIEIWQETGRRLQMLADGAVSGGSSRALRNPTGGRPLSTVAAGLTSVEQVRALVEAWEDYNDQLADAGRRQDLVLDERAARRAFDLAKGMKDRTAALEDLKEAQKRLREFDAAAAIDRERKAVDKILDALAAEEKARDAAARAAEELAEARERATEQAEQAQEAALSRLNRLLDQERALRGRQVQLEQQAAADRRRLAEQSNQEGARFAAEQAALRARQVDAERRHVEQLAQLRVELAADEARLLEDRRDNLAGSTALDQMIAFERGVPADWLVANARRQVDALVEWMDELARARTLGVSEQVIAALGLDEGPQALAQVRALTRASAGEIDALNDAVEERTRVAGEQVRREQVGNLGQLAQALAAAQMQYQAAVLDLQASYRTEQKAFADDLLRLQDDYVRAQDQIRAALAEVQARLIEEQTALADELAQLGIDQGRAYGDALAEGLRSALPGVRAAAAELAAAMAALGAAQAAAASPPTTSTPPLGALPGGRQRERRYAGATPGNPLGLADPNAKPGTVMYGVPLRSYDSGGWLQPGYTLAYNGTGQPERILTSQQMSGGGDRVVQFMPGAEVTIRETVDVDLLLHRAEFLVSAGGFE
jgi:TP901 family phage tail tape measure protein